MSGQMLPPVTGYGAYPMQGGYQMANAPHVHPGMQPHPTYNPSSPSPEHKAYGDYLKSAGRQHSDMREGASMSYSDSLARASGSAARAGGINNSWFSPGA